MMSIKLLGLSALSLLAFISLANAACPTASRAKMDVCVATFSTANLGNRDDRKERIDAGNTTCPVDILKDSCTSFDVMIKCVNLAGFPEGCESELNTELKNQNFECTYLELGTLCPDADKIAGASSVVASLSLIVCSLLAFIYSRV